MDFFFVDNEVFLVIEVNFKMLGSRRTDAVFANDDKFPNSINKIT
jgi:hypothetical protein